MGKRSTRFDLVVRASIVASLREGKPRSVVAREAGVGVQTLETWIENDPEFAALVAQAENEAPKRGKVTPPAEVTRGSKLREDAAKLAPGMMGALLLIDGMLAPKGVYPMTEFWRETLADFYASGKRYLWVRVGRGGAKSYISAKVAIAESLFGDHSWLGAGEQALWPFMSTDMTEAGARMHVITDSLRKLGVEFDAPEKIREGQRIFVRFADLDDRQIAIVVFPASVKGASGPTLAGFSGDEMAKWQHDSDKGLSSDTEVMDAIGPAFRGRTGTHGYCLSSAFAEHGAHYHAIEARDTQSNYVARLGRFWTVARDGILEVAAEERDPKDRERLELYAASLGPDSVNVPTWVANPSITAKASRADARTVAAWLREICSVPMGSAKAGFFDPFVVKDALRRERPAARPLRVAAALDTGSTSNACALAIVGEWPGPVYAPIVLRTWTPSPGAPLDLRLVVLPAAKELVLAHGCDLWLTDAHALDQVYLVAREGPTQIRTRCVSSELYTDFYQPVLMGLSRGQIALAGEAELARQLGLVRSLPGDKGRIRIVVEVERDGATGSLVHGDLGVAFVRACAHLMTARKTLQLPASSPSRVDFS